MDDLDPIAQEERRLLSVIAELKQSYELAAKPFVDRLVYLKSIQVSPKRMRSKVETGEWDRW